MSEMTINTFTESLKDLFELEKLLAEQEVLLKVFRKYSESAVRPVAFKNVATMGMFTLTATWAILDVFAFMSGHPKIGTGCTIFTILLGLFFLRMKLREKKITEKKIAEFEEYMEKYRKAMMLTDTEQELKQLLELIYEKVNVLPRYRDMNAVSAMIGYLESGRAKSVHGEGSAYKIYDSEASRSRIEDVKKMVAPPVDDIELVPAYLDDVHAKMAEIAVKYESISEE